MFVCSHTTVCFSFFCSLLACVCSLFFVSFAASWRIKINNSVNAKYFYVTNLVCDLSSDLKRRFLAGYREMEIRDIFGKTQVVFDHSRDTYD